MALVNAPAALVVVAISLLIYTIFGQPKLRRNGVPLRRPPNTLPLAGNGIIFLRDRQKLFDWFTKCEQLYGYETLQISVPSLPPGVIISDPKNLEYVFKNEGIFAKGEFFKGRSRDLFGNGIINVDGELWKVQRKAGLNFLNTSNLRVLTDVALPQYLSQSVAYLGSQSGNDVVDLQAVFHEITTQLMGKMAYNMEMHAEDTFGLAFDYASGATAERFQNPMWFLTEIFAGARLRKSISVVKSFGQSIVSSAMTDRKASLKPAPVVSQDLGSDRLDGISGSLVQSLLDSIGDEQLVADAGLNYLSAGKDTTAQALTWTFYLLMQHPEVVAKIREEVDGIKKQSEEDTLEKAIAEQGNPNTMPYVFSVFYEALRIFPPIPFEIKQAVQATTLPDGTFLPQNSVVVWCTWAMNRSRTTWGSDADQFRPERWLVGGKVINKSTSEFPVFNGGPRTCLGKKMAEIIAVQVIATVAGLFDCVRVDDSTRVSKSSLTLPMKDGLPCFVHRRPDVEF
ncbi:cytochrome P450 [Colletotrichum scovillei]|uniref:Cytochrome P450 n=1 Tax=Colletotrichum scovillei TaxID=1209932 RepID=A0A9P7UEX4_9PEZI|nr:cytochrome P450 [Colletotrichum scovillei]KAF4781289.1 cytochrome P450 [Colletotrichum scovillei]KAG7045522.1 cytochrome P450 [Colletotrichum scovillei]KAG7052685.1 cytochrome P450 [Colletotrichum scovillei]KAG7064975.1 cytochrome P450 [Colletotrichum scovillei]